ncbi:hypothetical protein O181_004690 [Austropuccinia psidii MF-1]|uniref:Retrovirus-related Pol polyprotein from transposon TNT 1-94-like beta-barrel domain-containing protein n=1 Tax=Austropuccinia psidii MF-1 TaxID=1389203 RepID=A0A9Q3BGX3_9BASI|nr:hypothetical protein [Austropuccinia psidii MF-1]
MAESNTDQYISSVPILTGTNFSDWYGFITIFLKSKALLNVCKKSLDPKALTTLSNKWKKSSYEAVNIISSRECFAEHPHLRPPQQENKRKAGPNQSPAAQAFITGNNLPLPGQFLIVDCGATHHMFSSKKMVSSFKESLDIQASTGDSSSSLRAKAAGMVSILCHGKVLSLKNCLYVPKLNRNLISLLELCQDNMLIKRTENSFTLESDGNQILKGTIVNNLMQLAYYLPTALMTQSPINLAIPGKLLSNLWGSLLFRRTFGSAKSIKQPCYLSKMNLNI